MTISHESRTQAQCHCAIVYVLTSESDNWLDMTISRESRTHVQCQCAIVYVLSSYRDPPRESVKGAVRCDRRTRVGVMSNLLFRHFLLISWTHSYYVLLNWNAPLLFDNFLTFYPFFCIFLNFTFPSLFGFCSFLVSIYCGLCKALWEEERRKIGSRVLE